MVKLKKHSFFRNTEAKQALAEFILQNDRFSMGEQCARFEKRFAQWQGRKHGVFVSSGSMANLILIQALLNKGDLQKGDAIGFSALTWSTNVMPLIQLGLRPIPIDCELTTLNVSSKKLLETLDNIELKAFFITNALGFADDIDKISEICSERNILLIEDNCESLGSCKNGKKLGNFGFAATFSTFIGHHFSTIEGGLICTDDAELNKHLLICRAHGWDRNLTADEQHVLRERTHVDAFHSTYTFYELAFNGRPTEIQGFLGNYQLEYLDEIVAQRAKHFSVLFSAMKKSPVVQIDCTTMDIVSNFALPLIFEDQKKYLLFKKRFIEHDVEIRPIIAGNIVEQPFYKKYTHDLPSMPNATLIHKQGFYFANRHDLTDKELLLLESLLTNERVL